MGKRNGLPSTLDGLGLAKVVAVALFGVVTFAFAGYALTQYRAAPAASSEYTPSPIDLLTPTPTADALPEALFIGDSYTHGTGASDPANRWTSIVAQAKSWAEDNEGLGGTGFVATAGVNGCGRSYCGTYGEVINSLINADPSVVFIAGGQNDFRAYAADPDTVTTAIQATYENARSRFPDAQIISVGPTIIGDVSSAVEGLDAAVRTAAETVGAQYVNMIDPDVLDKSMDVGDGGHVNDTGHRAIAERVLSTIG